MSIVGAKSLSVLLSDAGFFRHRELGSRPAWGRTVLGTLTRVSTMLDLLFRSVFTMWNTSMMFCCWIISHTLQMAQKVPLRPPPFLNTEGRVSQTPSWVPHWHGGVATLAKVRQWRKP